MAHQSSRRLSGICKLPVFDRPFNAALEVPQLPRQFDVGFVSADRRIHLSIRRLEAVQLFLPGHAVALTQLGVDFADD